MGSKTYRPGKKGFSYRLSREKLKEFMGLSPEMKLQWLEEANDFVNKFLSEKRRKLWKKFLDAQG